MRSPSTEPARAFIAAPVRSNLLQRKCACGGAAAGQCSACEKKDSTLQRQAAGVAPGAVPPIVDQVVGAAGHALDATTRTFMESRLGHDFSRVRVHSDARAAASARAVGAQAYTVGRDVVFDSGRYAPATQEGRRLLAHELTHVAQQERAGASSGVQTATSISEASDPAEVEAERIAHEAISGKTPGPPRERGGATLHRAPTDEPAQAPKDDEVTLSSGLRLKTSTLAMMLSYCDMGKLDPAACVALRLEVEKIGRGPFGDRSPLGIPPLTLGPRPGSLSAPDFRKLMDDMSRQIRTPLFPGLPTGSPDQARSALQGQGLGTPAQQTPAATKPANLPNVGLSTLTTHTIDIQIGTIKVVIPKSIAFKSSKFPSLFGSSLQIGVTGEVTKLSELIALTRPGEAESKQPAPGAAPAQDKGLPFKITLSVTASGLRIFEDVTLSASYDASSRSFGGDLSFKIVGSNCQMVVPAEAVAKLKKAETMLKKYSENAAIQAGEKPGQPPADAVTKAFEIIEIIDTLYSAIKAIEDAKKQCTQGPTLKFGPNIKTGLDGKVEVGAGFELKF